MSAASLRPPIFSHSSWDCLAAACNDQLERHRALEPRRRPVKIFLRGSAPTCAPAAAPIANCCFGAAREPANPKPLKSLHRANPGSLYRHLHIAATRAFPTPPPHLSILSNLTRPNTSSWKRRLSASFHTCI